MPVTPEEWESGVAYTPLAKGFLSFLRENEPMGFSAEELFKMRAGISLEHRFDAHHTELGDVERALDGLVTEGKIESKELKNEETLPIIYYRVID